MLDMFTYYILAYFPTQLTSGTNLQTEWKLNSVDLHLHTMYYLTVSTSYATHQINLSDSLKIPYTLKFYSEALSVFAKYDRERLFNRRIKVSVRLL